jgi:hypothetical protein
MEFTTSNEVLGVGDASSNPQHVYDYPMWSAEVVENAGCAEAFEMQEYEVVT